MLLALLLAAFLALGWLALSRPTVGRGGSERAGGEAGGSGAGAVALAQSGLPEAFSAASVDGAVRSALERKKAVHKGVYLSALGAANPAIYDATIRLVARTELDAVVIDVKEDGTVYFDAQDPFVRSVGAVRPVLKDLPEKLAALKKAGVYTIARIVVFKDPGLARSHPEWAIQDARGGVWRDRTGQAWMDAYNVETWRYNVAIAEEAAKLGFDEIQFDYVRFPSDGRIEDARYPDAQGRTRVEAITGFLKAARAALAPLGVAVSADIFGLIPTAADDQFIGQHWEEVTASLDYVSPMLYPSHYAPRTFGLPNPNAAPAATVAHSMQDAIRRTVAWGAFTRPWLQDFSLYGVHYTPDMVRAEIDAAEANGATGWLLWNAANCYKPDALKPDPDAPPLPRFGDASTCSAEVRAALAAH
ncbi:MAG: putative glycoside hydrolase [Clostridia bacterium]|nr:putative glycoside hydrolase [Clostridia bacterium]